MCLLHEVDAHFGFVSPPLGTVSSGRGRCRKVSFNPLRQLTPLRLMRQPEVCRRLMTIPGVGPTVALTYRATIDVPARFRNSRAVGAVLGLTPCKYQSGESEYTGAISKCGDEMMRVMLYEAAQVLLMRATKWSWLKAWAMQIARRRGVKKAIVALARRLAVIMHRIWVDGTEFRWTRQQVAAA
jgi:transposase